VTSRLLASCLVTAALVAVGGAVASAESAGRVGHRYDEIFRKYSKRFFGAGYDWRLFKAQGLVESNLRPMAVSARGARGVMQVLPRTYEDIRLRHPDLGEIHDPEWNIAAGIFYARQQWVLWRDETERAWHHHFMLGSYNAGRSTLLRAQRMADADRLNGRRWPSIEHVAPKVPGWRHQETLGYVKRVFETVGGMDRQGRVRP
jgi:membrane-bound lytic murein transglycosylase F